MCVYTGVKNSRIEYLTRLDIKLFSFFFLMKEKALVSYSIGKKKVFELPN